MLNLYDMVKPLAEKDGLRLHGWSPDIYAETGKQVVLLSDNIGTVGVQISGWDEIQNDPKCKSVLVDLVNARYNRAKQTLAENQ